MKKFIFKSRTVKITFYPNLEYCAVYRNAMIVGKLKCEYSRTHLLLLALSANIPFRQCRGVDKLTITIFNDKCYQQLRRVAELHFPNANIN